MVAHSLGFMAVLFSRLSYRMLLSQKPPGVLKPSESCGLRSRELGSTLVRQSRKGKPIFVSSALSTMTKTSKEVYLRVRVYGTVDELEQILLDLRVKP